MSNINRYNLEKRKKLDTRDNKIIFDYKQGLFIETIAKKYHLTKNRVFQILEKKEVRQRSWIKMNREKHSEILILFNSGVNKAEIGRRIGVSRERIRQIIEEHKLENKTQDIMEEYNKEIAGENSRS